MRNEIIDDLVRDEGFREFAYRDTEGYLTIGIGFLIDPEHPGRIPMPREAANIWLLYEIKRREGQLDDRIPWWRELGKDQRRALLNMSYQLGVAGLMKFKKMLKALEEGQYTEAYEQALDSKWARQTPNRAKRVAELLK